MSPNKIIDIATEILAQVRNATTLQSFSHRMRTSCVGIQHNDGSVLVFKGALLLELADVVAKDGKVEWHVVMSVNHGMMAYHRDDLKGIWITGPGHYFSKRTPDGSFAFPAALP